MVPNFYGGKPQMRQQFLEAMQPDPLGYFERDGLGRNPFPVFEAILISYHYWARWPKIPTSSIVVGDSGGFSVATLGASIDPEEVILWQKRCTDIGYILDIPPYRAQASSAMASGRAADYWENSLARTLENVKRAAQHYRPDEEPFRWWGVCQGETRTQQDEWFEKVSEIYPFQREGEGWAMRPHPNNDFGSIARCVRFSKDNEIKNLHLLQTTGPRAVSVLIALGIESGLEFVTYDSETAARLAVSRSCTLRPESFPAFSLKNITESSRDGETTVRDYMTSGQCPCEGCSWLAEDEIPLGQEYCHYIMLHNYCVMQENFNAIEREAKVSPEELLRVATGDQFGTVRRAFEHPYQTNVGSGKKRSILSRLS